MRVTHGSQIRSRVLILFVTKKMIVDHSRVNTTFQINFWNGPSLNQLSEQLCSTFLANHTPIPMERFSIWFHFQRISLLVLVTITSHLTSVASGQRLRIPLFDVSDRTITNSMKVLLLTNTSMICTNMKNKECNTRVSQWHVPLGIHSTSMYKHTFNAQGALKCTT